MEFGGEEGSSLVEFGRGRLGLCNGESWWMIWGFSGVILVRIGVGFWVFPSGLRVALHGGGGDGLGERGRFCYWRDEKERREKDRVEVGDDVRRKRFRRNLVMVPVAVVRENEREMKGMGGGTLVIRE